MLVSERIGQLFVESDGGRDRLEYTEYGSGGDWVVLLPGLLMPRRMQQPLARAMAAQGLHVVTLDLLGHGRSDQPADPLVYSTSSFGEQVVVLLDHLGADQAVIGGTSLGANVALEVAVVAPERVRGLVVEMPVLDNALVAGVLAFVPIMLAARYVPVVADTVQRTARSVPRGLVPFWAGVLLDTVDHRADSLASVLHGVIFGRIAPSSSQRRRIAAPVLVVGHPVDPFHPFVDVDMLAAELPDVRVERASSVLEWRLRPERLTAAASDFAVACWQDATTTRRARLRKR
ncbi:alpha/beta fold hydrolase [Nocardioides sp. S-58]|uniref:Alpha/beta fold hydrolase n=1 Tax=Nocardioides renjunii TaxID=3095075 RepID=A0ABU5KBQ3_9ACTN|nr:alpha/beta fold hydrolase [Nocardioides sp. S-58]MDZ5662412.1 alpha/beta fold hydrolase [Nocardioides sp. S-58]